eukprot:1328487-Prymnesium_polylepis.1
MNAHRTPPGWLAVERDEMHEPLLPPPTQAPDDSPSWPYTSEVAGSSEAPTTPNARQLWAAHLIQHEFRIWQALLKPPDIAVARALADNGMPHAADDRLYRVKPLTEPLRSWRSGAPITMEAFDSLGVGVA